MKPVLRVVDKDIMSFIEFWVKNMVLDYPTLSKFKHLVTVKEAGSQLQGLVTHN